MPIHANQMFEPMPTVPDLPQLSNAASYRVQSALLQNYGSKFDAGQTTKQTRDSSPFHQYKIRIE